MASARGTCSVNSITSSAHVCCCRTLRTERVRVRVRVRTVYVRLCRHLVDGSERHRPGQVTCLPPPSSSKMSDGDLEVCLSNRLWYG